jgi:putative membrane protein
LSDESPAERGDVDPRLRYANERTFLAWIRTSLALMTAGLAITQLLPAFKIAGGRRMIGLPLIALGIWACWAAYRQWDTNEHAMERRTPIGSSRLPIYIAGVVGVIALLALILAAIGKS